MFSLKYNEVIQDKYKLDKKLGEGTYGVVVLAESRDTGAITAIKTMSKAKSKSEDESTVARFNEEVLILQESDHPNIVRLYEAYEDEKNFYLVTEYCKGGELFDFIVANQLMSEHLAANIMIQILRALCYCHSKNIVHRDLKPENILLLDKAYVNTGFPQLKLIDFGTSTIKQGPGKTLKRKCGTAYYIAPEVLWQRYDEKSDIWSCGVILYIMLCGYPPFNGTDDDQIFENIKKAQLEFDPMEWDDVSDLAKEL